MKLRDFKNDLKKEKLEIPDVYDKVKVEAYSRNITPKRNTIKPKTFNFKRLSFAVLSVFLLIFIISISVKNSIKTFDEVFSTDTTSMRKIINQKDLNTTVKNSNKNRVNIFENFGNFFSFSQSKNADTAIPESSIPDNVESSKTNVQVENVDEADIVKADGKYIYTLSKNTLTAAETNKGKISIIDQVEFTNSEFNKINLANSEMYVTDKYIIVLYEIAKYYIYDYGKEPAETDVNRENINVIIYDKLNLILNRKFNNPKEQYEIEGIRSTSRLINNNLFILSNYFIYNYFPYNTDDILLPKINGEEINLKDISYIKDSKVNAFSMLTTIKLDNEIKRDTQTLLGSSNWNVIYSTFNSLYLVENNFMIDLDAQYTTILKFDYDHENGTVEFNSTCNIRGTVLNQFSLDEYNGYLRVAVTDYYNGVTNKILIFEEKIVDNKKVLSEVGRLDKGIGKIGETIKSVRFNKDEVLVVTFRNIDPLYKIDLSDPKNPVLLSDGLEEPGFNSYLHYLNENLAFGIGYVDGFRGFKFALYDIVENMPKKIEEFTFDNDINYYNFEAATNHKAVFVDKTGDNYIVGFALHKNNSSSIYKIFLVNTESKTVSLLKEANFNNDFVNRMIRITEENNNYYYIIGFNTITSYNNNFNSIDFNQYIS